jgi:hypothetical protein
MRLNAVLSGQARRREPSFRRYATRRQSILTKQPFSGL